MRPQTIKTLRSGWWVLCCLWLTTFTLIAQTPKVLWSTDLGIRIQSSPAVAPDGTLYIGADDGILSALRPDGTIKWTYRTEGGLVATPTVAPNGNVYFGSMDKLMYAVRPDGNGYWFTSVGAEIAGSAAMSPSGNLYFGTTKGVLISLNSSGNERWRWPINTPIITSPAIGADGLIYFGGQDGVLYAMRNNGTLFWQYNTGERLNASPAIAPDGTVYVANLAGKITSLTAAGTVKWEKDAGSAVRASPVLTPDGTLLIGTEDGRLLCLGVAGETLWTYRIDGAIRSTPAVASDGTIYFGGYDELLHAVSSQGKLLWTFKTGDKISASPLILKDGTVIIGSWDGKVYALGGNAGPASNTWSAFRAGSQRTGAAYLSTPVPELKLTLSPGLTNLTAPAVLDLQGSLTGVVEEPTSVRLLLNSQQYSQLTAPPYHWSWRETNAGTYHFVMEASFNAHEPLISSTQTVTVSTNKMVLDTENPKLEIKAPDSNDKVRIPQIVLTGKAQDNQTVARVEFKLNEDEWKTAKGTTNWTAVVSLAPGNNVVRVRAVDEADNLSNESKRDFRRLVYARAKMEVIGQGSLKPDLRTEDLEVGNSYLVTAEPAAGWLFDGWNGSVTNKETKLNFTMQTNLTLRAVFKPNPFKVIAGDFYGLIYQTNAVSADYCGYFTLTTSEKGVFKVKLILGGEPHSLSGQFDADGKATAVIINRRKQALGISLVLNWRSTPDLITGNLFTENGEAQILGDRRVYDGKTHLPAVTGSYTMVLSTAASSKTQVGSGFATVEIKDDGRIEMKGKLGDGTPIAQSSILSPTGLWPLYLTPYGTEGLLIGWLQVADESFGDMHGHLNWIRPAANNGSAPRLQETLSVMGSKYTKPARKQRMMGFEKGLLGLEFGGFDELLALQLTLQNNNQVNFPGQKAEVISLKLDGNTGMFSGQFIHPANNQPCAMEGVLLQKQNWGAGYFQGPDSVGRVFVGPAN